MANTFLEIAFKRGYTLRRLAASLLTAQTASKNPRSPSIHTSSSRQIFTETDRSEQDSTCCVYQRHLPMLHNTSNHVKKF